MRRGKLGTMAAHGHGSFEVSGLDETILELRKALHSCSKAVESGDLCKSREAVDELSGWFDSVSQRVLSDPEDEELQNKALVILLEIQDYICSADEAILDAISGSLPKEVSRFSIVSQKCLEVADSIIDKLIELCGARFMLPILTGSFGYQDEQFHNPLSFAPLLHGISAAFLLIQRRQFENVKAALPIILNALKAISRDENIEKMDLILPFQRAIGVASSIQKILEGMLHDKLMALLTLFVLQITALASVSVGHEPSICFPLVTQLEPLFACCGLSHIGCITGSDVERASNILFEDDEDINETGCFSLVKHGACIAVIWSCMSNMVSESAIKKLSSIRDALQSNQEKRWQAIGMMKYIFTCNEQPWELKKQCIEFLLEITEEFGVSNEFIMEPVECSHYITSLYNTLQAIEILIMSAPVPDLRKKAYVALKRILADIPLAQRLDVMKGLIKSSQSSSMTAILINLLREEMHKDQKRDRVEISLDKNGTFWNDADVLEIVEHVLRPRKGLMSFIEDSDAVLSGLNLYRYILLTESSGKSNKTGILSITNLRKAYNEWLLPLRALVSMVTEDDTISPDYLCGLNPVELVLYRCIELVEEQLKCSS